MKETTDKAAKFRSIFSSPPTSPTTHVASQDGKVVSSTYFLFFPTLIIPVLRETLMAFQILFRHPYSTGDGETHLALSPKLPDQVPRAAACLSFDVRQNELL